MLVVGLGAAALLLSSCDGEACAGQALEDEEGHVYPCIGPRDCPRSGNGVLCTSTRDRHSHCVDCIHNVCVLFHKDSCG